MTSQEIADGVESSVKTVQYFLEALKRDGFVKRIGYFSRLPVYAINFEVMNNIRTGKFLLICFSNTGPGSKHETERRFYVQEIRKNA